jgi:hypothetical protein
MVDLTIENAKLFEQEAITPYEKVLARNLVAAMQDNERLRIELQAAANQVELLAYTSAGDDHGLSKFCAGLAGHLKSALNQNEI